MFSVWTTSLTSRVFPIPDDPVTQTALPVVCSGGEPLGTESPATLRHRATSWSNSGTRPVNGLCIHRSAVLLGTGRSRSTWKTSIGRETPRSSTQPRDCVSNQGATKPGSCH